MAPSYTIQVENESSITNNYIISQEPPQVTGQAQDVWPLVIARATVPPGGLAKFTIELPTPYYAYAISSQGEPGHGVSVDTRAQRPVSLGKKHDDGSLTPGSTLQFVMNEGVPDLRDADEPSNGFQNAFTIVTGMDFTDDDVKQGNILIGFGNKEQPWAAFAPHPLMKYQLEPRSIFYLYYVNTSKGSLVDVQQTGNALKLDFSSRSSRAKVKHEKTGQLVLLE